MDPDAEVRVVITDKFRSLRVNGFEGFFCVLRFQGFNYYLAPGANPLTYYMKPLFFWRIDKKIFLLVMLLSVGCTTPGMIMKSWVGHREEELLRQWGPPSKVIDNGRSGKIVTYVPDLNNKDGAKTRYVNARQPVEYIGPRNNEYKRTKSFYVTPMGTIYAWKWE